MINTRSAIKLIAILLLNFFAQWVHAALTLTGTTSYASNNADSNFSLNLPASVSNGDLLLAQINYGSASITVTAPFGWTLLRENVAGVDHQIIYYRYASGDSAGAATAWALSSNVRVAAIMLGVRSNLSRPISFSNQLTNTGNSASLLAGSINVSTPGMLLRVYGIAAGNTNFTLPGTLTQVATQSTPSVANGAALLVANRAIASASATGSDTVTSSRTSDWVAQSLMLSENAPTKPTTCFTDSFSNSASFPQDWATTSVGSTAFTPAIINGRLQLTSNNGNISTAATLRRQFPTSNLLYVEFNYFSYPSSNGADGVAVTLSDANVTPQPGGFGGSLGYAQRSGINGFAGGWVGIALDEYGNYSNATEGRNGGLGFRKDSVAIRGSGSAQTGYAYVAGTNANLNPEVDSNITPGPGHRYRIVIDAATPGQTYVTVDRDTSGSGSSYANLIPTFNIASAAGQATIPANLILSFTGSTGGSSNTHEIGNLSVCATTINNPNQVDHFEFTHDGQGLTCEAENVTIRACANADCSALMSVPVSVTLSTSSPTGAWVGGSAQTITNGVGVFQFQRTLPTTVSDPNNLFIANSSPGVKPFSTNKCNGIATNNCALPFVDAGLAFDVPDLLANKPSGAVRLRAVKNSGDASNSCVALFQGAQSINFWSTYTTPNTGTRPVELRAGSGSGTFTNISGNSAAPTALNLNFNASGETTFEARYQDAGLMMLNARYNGSGTYAGLVLNGSDSFVATPAGFCVQAATTSAPTTYLTCPAGDASCPVFATAGNPFVLNIAAAAWQVDGETGSDFCTGNGNTPNYVQNSLVLGSHVIAPIATPTKIDGDVTPITANITANGAVTLATATESEVGVFTFTVTPPNYFGVTIPPGISATIGRFIPHHFSLTAGSSLINRATSCAIAPAFTYIGETLNLGYQLNARNANNVLTQNYQGAFTHLSTFTQMKFAAIAGSPRTALSVTSTLATPTNPDPVVVTSWADGKTYVSTPVYIAKTATPVGPYLSTAFGIAPVDSDGVAGNGFDLDTNAPADSTNEHFQTGPVTELRYGRLRLDSVSGPTDMSLSIPVTAEYWSGSAFTINTADTGCTTINSSSALPLSGFLGSLSSANTSLSGSGVVITNGQAPNALILSAPGAGHEGSVDITLPILSNWPWLQFDWNGDGTLDANATATASFGTYRGSDRVIYWLETQ